MNVLLEGSPGPGEPGGGRGSEGKQKAAEAGADIPAGTAMGPQKLMAAFGAFLIERFWPQKFKPNLQGLLGLSVKPGFAL